MLWLRHERHTGWTWGWLAPSQGQVAGQGYDERCSNLCNAGITDGNGKQTHRRLETWKIEGSATRTPGNHRKPNQANHGNSLRTLNLLLNFWHALWHLLHRNFIHLGLSVNPHFEVSIDALWPKKTLSKRLRGQNYYTNYTNIYRIYDNHNQVFPQLGFSWRLWNLIHRYLLSSLGLCTHRSCETCKKSTFPCVWVPGFFSQASPVMWLLRRRGTFIIHLGRLTILWSFNPKKGS